MGKRVVKEFAILQNLFYFHTGVIGATYTIYLLSKGFSLFEASMLSSTFNIASIVFEIPSGVLSDVLGRKRCAFFSGISLFISMLLFLVFNHIFFLILAQLFWGLSYALESGNTESWAINQGNIKGIEIDYMLAYTMKYRSLCSIIGSVIGNYLANYSLNLIWLLPVVTSFIFIIYSQMVMKSDYGKYSKIQDKSIQISYREFLSHISKSISILQEESIIRKVYFLTIFFTIISTPLMIFWSVYIKEIAKFENFTYLSFVWFGIQIAIFLGNQILQKILNHSNRISIFIICTLLFSLCSFLMFFSANIIFVVSMILLQEMLLVILMTSIRGFTNEIIQPQSRATMLSILEFFSSLGKIMFSIIFSGLADYFGIQFVWASSSVLGIVTILYLLANKFE